jgi:two-component system response regulator FixJ
MNASACIGIVDDDPEIRQSLAVLLDVAGYRALAFASGAELIDAGITAEMTCLLIDVRLAAGEDGIALLDRLRAAGVRTPVIVVTAHGDIPMAVRAIRAGAVDFVEKPFTSDRLLKAIADARETGAFAATAAAALARLTPRERQVLLGLAEGKANKIIAAELGISPRTVETYRADIMQKLGTRSLAETFRIALAGGAVPGA